MVNKIDTDALLEKIEAETGCQCEVFQAITDEDALCIPVEDLQAVIGVLREDFDCYHLSGITAQQRESRPGEIELIYHFWHGKGLSLLLRLPADDPKGGIADCHDPWGRFLRARGSRNVWRDLHRARRDTPITAP
jgi:hypothetical protein